MENTFTYNELDFIDHLLMSEVEECDKFFYEEMYGINFKELYDKISDMMYEVRTNDSPEKMQDLRVSGQRIG